VQIAPSSTAPIYSEAGRFSFRMVPPDDRQGAFLAEALAERFEGARVGLLFVNDDYGRGLHRETLARLDPERFPVVVDLPHTEESIQTFDAEGTVASLVDHDVELLLWLGRVPALERILLPLREQLGAIPVVAGDAVSRVLMESDRPGRHWEGVAFVDFLDPEGTPELRAFRERFLERFGHDPGGPEILSYDAARLVLAAIGEGARTGEEVRSFLVSLGRERPPFAGLGGPVTFDAHGDVDRSYVLRVISGPDR
jgi:branched-chain amino acid transport system substrate-binding protein